LIINMKHELVELAGWLDWQHLDEEIAPLYSDKGLPGIATRFVIGLIPIPDVDRWRQRSPIADISRDRPGAFARPIDKHDLSDRATHDKS
jgi:hypothetical protein